MAGAMRIQNLFVNLCLIIVLVSCSQDKVSKVNSDDESKSDSGIVKVMSENGIVLREKADKKSAKLAAIPWGTEIEMIDSSGPIEIIDGVGGHWVKVKYIDKSGWVFGGFLTRKIGTDFVNIYNNIDIFSEAGFNLGISWTYSKDEIIKKLGEPVKTETIQVVSPADNKEYPRHILKYKMYKIEVDEFKKTSSVASIEVSSAQHANFFGVKIGENINKLIQNIGEPSEISAAEVEGKEYQVYQFIPMAENLFQSIDVFTVKGRIAKIRWFRAVE